MSESPPPIKDRSCGKNPFRAIARASWVAPLIGLVLNLLLVASGTKTRFTDMFISLVFLGGGLLLGIVALFGIVRYGRNGILVPALVGIGIPVGLFVLALPNLHSIPKRTRFHGPTETAVHSSSARLLKDEKLRFSMDIPQGFEEWPEGMTAANVVHCFARDLSDSDGAHLVINIQRLNGTIPPNEPLRREDAAKHAPLGVKLDLIQKNWRGLKVDTFVSEVSQNGIQVIAYGIQIPLLPFAIQVNVGGPISHRREVERLADEILVSVEGNTNWQTQ